VTSTCEVVAHGLFDSVNVSGKFVNLFVNVKKVDEIKK